MIEFKTYKEIDLDENPIVVLGCKHFFTADTLDGHLKMSEVYEQDEKGNYTAIKDTSGHLQSSIPQCPDCRSPLRQFATPRYNRIINRAVIDEMSKRFLISGQADLRSLENEIDDLERYLEERRPNLIDAISEPLPRRIIYIEVRLEESCDKSAQVEKAAENLCKKVAEKHEPVTKLHDATINAIKRRPVEESMSNLSLAATITRPPRDRRIPFGARGAQLKLQYVQYSSMIRSVFFSSNRPDSYLHIGKG